MACKKVPLRTCISCRLSKPKQELIRVVKTLDGIKVDTTGKLNGRGAYICKDKACFEKLKKSKGLNRVFEMTIEESIYDELAGEIFGKQ